MKKLILLCSMTFFALCINAQEEDMMTESSVPAEESPYIDDLVKRTLTEDSRMVEWIALREADIAWEKRIWRIIDTREKINLPFRYENAPFFNILKEMVENGDITAFDDEFFQDKLTPEDIEKRINRIDTTTVFDYDTYEEKVTIVKNTINWEDIKKFRMKEIWFFNENTSRMDVRIIGLAPIKDEIDYTTGELKYSLPLFWIYYPEAKNFFAEHRVYNEFNDLAPNSWYDVFEGRQFSSYIMKQSNALDLRIQDMFEGYDNAGIDRLLEAAKIENELFNFEHDLWEY